MNSTMHPRKTLLRLVALAALALALVACAGAGVGGPTGELTQEDAQAFVSLAQQSLDYQLDLMASPESVLVGMSPTGLHPSQTSCVVGAGDPSDGDGDGIPNDVTYTYACTEAEHGFDASGSVRVQDFGSAFRVAFDALTFGFGAGAFAFDGSIDVTWSHPTYTTRIDIAFTFSDGGTSGSFAYAMDQTFTSSHTPTDPFGAGQLDLDGSIDVAADGESYGLDATADLAIDDACATGVASGSAAYADSAGNTLTLTYACSTVTATYNGAPLAALAN